MRNWRILENTKRPGGLVAIGSPIYFGPQILLLESINKESPFKSLRMIACVPSRTFEERHDVDITLAVTDYTIRDTIKEKFKSICILENESLIFNKIKVQDVKKLILLIHESQPFNDYWLQNYILNFFPIFESEDIFKESNDAALSNNGIKSPF